MPDRYGDAGGDHTPTARDEHEGCTNGWLGTDLDDRPVPCLLCRPHLRTTTVVHDRAQIR